MVDALTLRTSCLCGGCAGSRRLLDEQPL